MAVSIPSSLFTLEKKNVLLKRLTFEIAETKKSRFTKKNPEITCMYFYNEQNECFTFPVELSKKESKLQVIDDYNRKMNDCIEAKTLSIPFWFAKTKCKYFPSLSFEEHEIKFGGKLRPHQEEVCNELFPILERENCCILGLYTAFGKTVTSLFIASQLKLKTFIIVNRLILTNQWVESIHTFLPNVKVQIVTSKTEELDPEAFFYIGSVQIVYKFQTNRLFTSIGTLIYDEVHTMASPTGLKAVHLFSPRYFLGLSATPKKQNTNITDILGFYFGKNLIVRKMRKEFNVYKVNTGITFEKKFNPDGSLNWGWILEQQAIHEERNNLIVKIIRENKDSVILVLCKRKKHVNILLSKLQEKNEHVTKLISTDKVFDKDARILLSTVSKSGTGFDHDKLNMLIMAGDVDELFTQYLGRVFRKENVTAKVFDLVDDFGVLETHWRNRQQIYKDSGGTFCKY